jgi:hypothetical protein
VPDEPLGAIAASSAPSGGKLGTTCHTPSGSTGDSVACGVGVGVESLGRGYDVRVPGAVARGEEVVMAVDGAAVSDAADVAPFGVLGGAGAAHAA